MAVSRPFLLVVLGAVLVVGTFTSMRSAAERAQADDTAAAPTVVKTAPEPSASQKTSPAPAAPKAKKSAPAKKAEKKAAPTVAGLPAKVGKAFKAHRTIVLFFRQPGADDDATAKAVHAIRGTKRVSVFSVPLKQLGKYRRVVNGLGVTQAPAVVIVGKDRKARLVEGYVDPDTLRQQVRDAR